MTTTKRTTKQEQKQEEEEEEALRLKTLAQSNHKTTINSKSAKIREKAPTFWTACSTCRVLHQFERKYLGQKLVCPGCNKSFKAVEALQNDESSEEEEDKTLGDFILKKKNEGKMGCEKGESFKGNDEVGVVGRMRKKMRLVGEVLESFESNGVVGIEEETMTLAEFQSKVKTKIKGQKENKMKNEGFVKRKWLRVERDRDRDRDSSDEELEGMSVADSDFYDFDKDRVERSFKKGQVWALYDDDDGMPRDYALIDEIVSVNPFVVSISWLDLENNGDGVIVSREKLGFHVPCGRFKVAKEDSISSVNVFSHVVDCDQAARKVYKIYPKKGSVWALYNKETVDAGDGKRCYDIVVFLTNYSEMNGVSMAFLEKVDGYKTVFKRQDFGSHAVRFLGKEDFGLISHQIPARKFSDEEAPELLKDCWELDPASLPSDLLTTGGIDD